MTDHAHQPPPNPVVEPARRIDRRRFLATAGAVTGAAAGLAACGGAGSATGGSGTAAAARRGPFRSRPDLQPPRIRVATAPAQRSSEDHVFTDVHAGTGQQGALIIDRGGELAYFEPVSDHGGNGRRIFNVRVQEYRGEPVMTYWLGPMVSGHGEGDYYLYDQSYRQVAKVKAGNGYQGDLHEFRLTPRGTALLTAYGTAHAEITSSDVAGGSHYGPYFYGIAQEVDVATGRVLMQWRSDEHVPLDAVLRKAAELGREQLGLLPHQLDRGRSRRRQPDHLGTQLLGVLQGPPPHRRGDLALRRTRHRLPDGAGNARSASSTTSFRTATACSPCSTTRAARRRRRASHAVWCCTSTSGIGGSGSCARCTTGRACTRARWAASRSSTTAASSWAGASRPGSPNTTATAGSCSTRGWNRSASTPTARSRTAGTAARTGHRGS